MIVTVGSINMDMVIKVERQPQRGETIIGSDYALYSGGKGANQAVAAVRLGVLVRMAGAVGRDAFGAQLVQSLKAEGVDTAWVMATEHTSGIAVVTVDDQGGNSIVVSPGANANLKPADIPDEIFKGSNVLLLQHEIPLETIQDSAYRGGRAGAKVVLNTAPALKLGPEAYTDVDVLVLNELEAATLTGQSSPQGAREALEMLDILRAFVPTVVLTLGDKGAVWAEGNEKGHIQAIPVEAVDTTAAGDAFVGALAVGLSRAQSLQDALRFANAVGALATTKPGAQASLPTAHDVAVLLEESVL